MYKIPFEYDSIAEDEYFIEKSGEGFKMVAPSLNFGLSESTATFQSFKLKVPYPDTCNNSLYFSKKLPFISLRFSK